MHTQSARVQLRTAMHGHARRRNSNQGTGREPSYITRGLSLSFYMLDSRRVWSRPPAPLHQRCWGQKTSQIQMLRHFDCLKQSILGLRCFFVNQFRNSRTQSAKNGIISLATVREARQMKVSIRSESLTGNCHFSRREYLPVQGHFEGWSCVQCQCHIMHLPHHAPATSCTCHRAIHLLGDHNHNSYYYAVVSHTNSVQYWECCSH